MKLPALFKPMPTHSSTASVMAPILKRVTKHKEAANEEGCQKFKISPDL